LGNFKEFKFLGNLNDSIKLLSFLNTFVWMGNKKKSLSLFIRDDNDVGFMFKRMVENNVLHLYVHSNCRCL